MNQTMFEPYKLARRNDPMTSHEAAKRVRDFAHGHSLTILACLRKHGSLTVDEIAEHTGLTSPQVNKRLPELQRQGWTQPTGVRRLSASGHSARVWMAL